MSYTHLSCSCSTGELSHRATASCKGGWEVESLHKCPYAWPKIYVCGRGGDGFWQTTSILHHRNISLWLALLEIVQGEMCKQSFNIFTVRWLCMAFI